MCGGQTEANTERLLRFTVYSLVGARGDQRRSLTELKLIDSVVGCDYVWREVSVQTAGLTDNTPRKTYTYDTELIFFCLCQLRKVSAVKTRILLNFIFKFVEWISSGQNYHHEWCVSELFLFFIKIGLGSIYRTNWCLPKCCLSSSRWSCLGYNGTISASAKQLIFKLMRRSRCVNLLFI